MVAMARCRLCCRAPRTCGQNGNASLRNDGYLDDVVCGAARLRHEELLVWRASMVEMNENLCASNTVGDNFGCILAEVDLVFNVYNLHRFIYDAAAPCAVRYGGHYRWRGQAHAYASLPVIY